MEEEKINEIITRIREKAGDEVSAMISDDLGLIMTNNSNMLKEREKLNGQISSLELDKENLISANGNLLKQVGVDITTESNNSKKEEPKEPFSFKKMFDEKGNFIK